MNKKRYYITQIILALIVCICAVINCVDTLVAKSSSSMGFICNTFVVLIFGIELIIGYIEGLKNDRYDE